QQIDPTGAPLATEVGSRGVPLAERDEGTREAIGALNGRIDTHLALKTWQASLETPDWMHPPVWFHGDLLPGNVLFHQRQPHAVIDFGSLAVGDPACDLMIAWGLFTGESRQTFRAALGVDEATWRRGRGMALSQAVIFIPYYWHTNPVGVQRALWAVQQVLADFQASG
ncbi:MAG: phosphotransferase, partial [Chloroflexota bacterium]